MPPQIDDGVFSTGNHAVSFDGGGLWYCAEDNFGLLLGEFDATVCDVSPARTVVSVDGRHDLSTPWALPICIPAMAADQVEEWRHCISRTARRYCGRCICNGVQALSRHESRRERLSGT